MGTHLKNVDQGSWQGAVRRKSAAYTLVCEHFEPSRNTAMSEHLDAFLSWVQINLPE
jgi:hypothetical protein